MGYAKLPRLIPDEAMYWNEGMGTMEAVLPPGGYKTTYGPGLLELENGDLLCVWFASSFEGNADVSVICAGLKKGSSRWEESVLISHNPDRGEQNPSLFTGPGGKVWVIYTSQLSRVEGKDNMQFTSVIHCQKSTDGGGTWSDYETILPKGGGFCRQPIRVLEGGRWVFGDWICTDSELGLTSGPTAFCISDDQGKTWKTMDMPESNDAVHANVMELEPGRLAAFTRSHATDHIYRSESMDNGNTWTTPVPTVLPDNNSSISAVELKSGRIVIAYNSTYTPCPIPGVASWPGLRCPVAVALSEGGGLTFPMIRYMERGEGCMDAENETSNRQYKYPYIMQDADGRLYLAFTYKGRLSVKHMGFTKRDIVGKKYETVGLYNSASTKAR